MASRKSPKRGKGRSPARGTNRARERRPRIKAWHAAFLEALERRATVSEAAAQAGIGRNTAYDEREKSTAFAARWDAAVNERNGALIKTMASLAIDGELEDVYHDGVVCGQRRVRFPSLMIFLAKSWMPRVYNLAPGDAGEAGSGGREQAAEFGRALAGMFRAVPKPEAAA